MLDNWVKVWRKPVSYTIIHDTHIHTETKQGEVIPEYAEAVGRRKGGFLRSPQPAMLREKGWNE